MSDLTAFAKIINKTYGANSLVRLGDQDYREFPSFSTGSIGMDAASGIGGYPKGRIVVMTGDPMSGKTTLALHATSEVQRKGENVLYVDAEHALDVKYANALGVNINDLWMTQPDYGEQALRIVEDAIKSKEFGLIIVDSVAALVPKRELDGEIGDAQVGLLARMMSQACRKFTAIAHASGTTIIFINQYRANIATTGFGGPTKTTPGGKALDYFASMIISVSRIQSIKDDGVNVANRTKVEFRKNKLATPYRTAEFDIQFGIGIDKASEFVELCETFGLITKKSSWYSIDGKSVAQGRPGMVQYLSDNPDIKQSLVANLNIALGVNRS